ncbi:hypothetical protein ACFQ6S_33585 [Streptomyces sp. NPDC056479]|uniref:hypothetical protein n=1 Tax=Streptomyces sp. NPDC056479 TaxID=3345832 RepID=UPI0036A214B7
MTAWVSVVVVAGGATLWLRDSPEPPGPYGREAASPTPSLPEGWESACAGAERDGKGQALCFFRTR